jgi:hypothetical protein
MSEADPNKVENMREVTEATKKLLNQLIPQLAIDLSKRNITIVNHKQLINEMHNRGINASESIPLYT